MNARIVELELNDTHHMREDGPTVLHIPADASLASVIDAPICPDLRDLFRRTLNGNLTSAQYAELTVGDALHTATLAPRWVSALLALDAQVKRANDADMQLGRYLAQTENGATAVQIPLNVPGRMWCATELAPADGPALGVMAVIDLDNHDVVRAARLALCGLGEKHIQLVDSARQLIGSPLNDTVIELVAAAVVEEVQAHGFSLNGTASQLADVTRAAFKTCRCGNCD